MSKCGIIDERRVQKYLQGSGRGLLEVGILVFAEGTEED
jgi:hypothetical protein